MKKLVLSLAILGFIAFGTLSVQNIIASTSQVEMVNFDKDPKKENAKKVADTKEVKAETTSSKENAKDCSSSCSDKAASSEACCDKGKTSCCSSTPDKK